MVKSLSQKLLPNLLLCLNCKKLKTKCCNAVINTDAPYYPGPWSK